MTNITAPKPRDFRKAPATTSNPLKLRAMEPDEAAAAEMREPRGGFPLNTPRLVHLTNGEVAALAAIADAAIRVPGIVSPEARKYVTGALRSLARTLASV